MNVGYLLVIIMIVCDLVLCFALLSLLLKCRSLCAWDLVVLVV